MASFSFTGWNSRSLSPKASSTSQVDLPRTDLDSLGRPLLPAGHKYDAVQPKALADRGVYAVTGPNGKYNTLPPRSISQTTVAAGPSSPSGTLQAQPTATGSPVAPVNAPTVPAGATLVGQVGAGQGPGNLPSWLSDAVSGLNSGSSLLTALQGLLGGAGAAGTVQAYDPRLGVAAVNNANANYNSQVNQMNEQARLANLISERNQLQSPVFGLSNPFDAQRRMALDRQISDFQRVNIPAAAAGRSGWVGGQPRIINGLLNGTGYA